MKTFHLYPDPHSQLGDWRTVDGQRDTLFMWAFTTAENHGTIQFHLTEAEARAAAEPENNLLSAVVAERDKAKGDLATACTIIASV